MSTNVVLMVLVSDCHRRLILLLFRGIFYSYELRVTNYEFSIFNLQFSIFSKRQLLPSHSGEGLGERGLNPLQRCTCGFGDTHADGVADVVTCTVYDDHLVLFRPAKELFA